MTTIKASVQKAARYLQQVFLPTIVVWSVGVAQVLAAPPAPAAAQPVGGDLAPHRAVGIINPIGFDSIEGLLVAILNIVIVIATPIIVFFIIYAGFLYVTARGNAEQIKQATNALTYSIIGGVIIIGAVAIAAIVKDLVATF